jgi:hypothetical protein
LATLTRSAGSETIYQSSDLNKHGRAILNDARDGVAHLRDTDGVALVVTRGEWVGTLEVVAQSVANFVLIEGAVNHGGSGHPTLAELGDWTWLRSLDETSLRAFLVDIRESLLIAAREFDAEPLRSALREWHATADSLSDPVRREILLGQSAEGDYDEVARPE